MFCVFKIYCLTPPHHLIIEFPWSTISSEERTLVNERKENDDMTSQLPPKLRDVLENPKSAEEKHGKGSRKKSGKISTSSTKTRVPGPAPPESTMADYPAFVEEHADMMEHYSEMKDLEEIRDFLRGEGAVLFADHAQSYLLLSCLEDEMNGKRERMKNTARQSQVDAYFFCLLRLVLPVIYTRS